MHQRSENRGALNKPNAGAFRPHFLNNETRLRYVAPRFANMTWGCRVCSKCVKCRYRLHTAEPPTLVPQPSHALPPRPAPSVWRRRVLQPRLRQQHRRWQRRPLCTAPMGRRCMARASSPPRPPMPARPPSRSPIAAGRLLRRGAVRKHWKRRRRGRWRERPPPPRRRRRRCRRRSRCRRRCRHCRCPLHRGRRAPVCPRGGRCLPLIRRTRRRPWAAGGMAVGALGGRRHGAFGSLGRDGAPDGRRWRPGSVLCGRFAARGPSIDNTAEPAGAPARHRPGPGLAGVAALPHPTSLPPPRPPFSSC